MRADRATAAAADSEPTDLLSVSEVVRWAGVSRPTIMHWIRAGRLPTARSGRRHAIRPADLAAAQDRAHAGVVVPLWRADRQRVGQRLRLLREATGMSQLALAAATGLTHEAISRLEHGQPAPYAETVRRLAQALGVAPERFIAYDPLGLSTLTVAEAAWRLDVPVGRVQNWLRLGVLEGGKVSGRWRVPSVAVAELGRSGRLRGHSRRLDPRYRG